MNAFNETTYQPGIKQKHDAYTILLNIQRILTPKLTIENFCYEVDDLNI